jgi:enoyl-[acyl-carrier protein] reductase I
MEDSTTLATKKGLVIGIANDQSIAYGCSTMFRNQGAELAITYLNEKAEKYVRPLAEQLESPIFLPCDVQQPGQLEAVFEAIQARWGKLDFLLHSIAFAPRDDLHGRLVDSSLNGFTQAMDVSCHSFIRMAKLAEPLMNEGGCLLTLSYYGAEKVIPNYGLMGPVKAALESVVRYLAAELGPQGIRVHALSPGTIKTRAGSGIAGFDALIEETTRRTPGPNLATIDDVGALAAFLVSDTAKALTGSTYYIDAGYHVMG